MSSHTKALSTTLNDPTPRRQQPHPRLAAPAPQRQRGPVNTDLDDRSLFASAHTLEVTSGGYTWR